MKILGCAGGAFALLLTGHNLAAQQVLGRAVREPDGSPLLEALIILLDDRGHNGSGPYGSPDTGLDRA